MQLMMLEYGPRGYPQEERSELVRLARVPVVGESVVLDEDVTVTVTHVFLIDSPGPDAPVAHAGEEYDAVCAGHVDFIDGLGWVPCVVHG